MPEPTVIELPRMNLTCGSIPDNKILLKALVKKGIMPITEEALADYKAKCEKRRLNFFERCLRRNLNFSHITRVIIILAAIALIVCSPEMWVRGAAFIGFCFAVWPLGYILNDLDDKIVWRRKLPHNVGTYYMHGDLAGIRKVIRSSTDALYSEELPKKSHYSHWILNCYPRDNIGIPYIFIVSCGNELYGIIAWEYGPSIYVA